MGGLMRASNLVSNFAKCLFRSIAKKILNVCARSLNLKLISKPQISKYLKEISRISTSHDSWNHLTLKQCLFYGVKTILL